MTSLLQIDNLVIVLERLKDKVVFTSSLALVSDPAEGSALIPALLTISPGIIDHCCFIAE